MSAVSLLMRILAPLIRPQVQRNFTANGRHRGGAQDRYLAEVLASDHLARRTTRRIVPEES
jgi:hypothetical protein